MRSLRTSSTECRSRVFDSFSGGSRRRMMRETSCAGTLAEQQQIDIGYSRQRKKATQKKRVFARPLEPRRQSAQLPFGSAQRLFGLFSLSDIPQNHREQLNPTSRIRG